MTQETRELTDPEKVMRLKAFVAIYDRAMLEKSSLDWFERIAGEVEALPLDASPEETQRLFSQVMRAYIPLSMAHLSQAAIFANRLADVDPLRSPLTFFRKAISPRARATRSASTIRG